MESRAAAQLGTPGCWVRVAASIRAVVTILAIGMVCLLAACQRCPDVLRSRAPRFVPSTGAGDPAPAVGRPATATCVLNGRIYEIDGDGEPLAGALIAVELSRFYIHSGMGMVSAYARAVARTDSMGAYSLNLPQPAVGTMSRIKIAVQQPTTLPPPIIPRGSSDPSGAWEVSDSSGAWEIPFPGASGVDRPEADHYPDLPVFRMSMGAMGPHGGVATWEAPGRRHRVRYACEWQVSDCGSE